VEHYRFFHSNLKSVLIDIFLQTDQKTQKKTAKAIQMIDSYQSTTSVKTDQQNQADNKITQLLIEKDKLSAQNQSLRTQTGRLETRIKFLSDKLATLQPCLPDKSEV
jgi:chromosome segregation ATPase